MENNRTLEEIIEMWRSGMNTQQIANRTGMKYHKVYLQLKSVALVG
jgi:hypothetical protein